jgi:hypothetical protein
MADDDLFGQQSYYPAVVDKGPFVFILSGTATYGDLKGFVARGANEDGSDGTVRASSASLDSIKLKLDYQQPQGYLNLQRQLNRPFAFKLVEAKNHTEIVPRDPIDPHHPTLGIIRECFAINDSTAYQKLGDKFAAENAEFYQRQRAIAGNGVHAYQQFVMHLIDEMGNDVHDYRVDFHVIDDDISVNSLTDGNLRKLQQYGELTQRLQSEVVVDVEPHTENTSYRTFFINIDALDALETEIAARARNDGKAIFIAMNIDAVGPTANLTYNTEDLQYIRILGKFPTSNPAKDASFFKANTTTLVEITISRMADDQIFKFLFDAN